MPGNCLPSEDAQRRFGRTVDFLGETGFARLRESMVLIVGLGGVGSHAAVMLARSGVGRLRIVDADRITWTSLNRHAVATPADEGQPKALVLARHLEIICPDTRVDAREAFFHEDTAAALLSGPPDYVIDAIDSVTPKTVLLAKCYAQAIPVVSCMGAAARLDPTRIEIADLSKSDVCPLAKMVRKRLRRQGIQRGIRVVFSREEGKPTLPPDPQEQTTQRGRRRRRLPSLGPIPGIFGYAAAAVVMQALAGEE